MPRPNKGRFVQSHVKQKNHCFLRNTRWKASRPSKTRSTLITPRIVSIACTASSEIALPAKGKRSARNAKAAVFTGGWPVAKNAAPTASAIIVRARAATASSALARCAKATPNASIARAKAETGGCPAARPASRVVSVPTARERGLKRFICNSSLVFWSAIFGRQAAKNLIWLRPVFSAAPSVTARHK